MKFLTSTISVLTLVASVTLIASPINAQSTRSTIGQTPVKPENSLNIRNSNKETTKGETATCKGGLRVCEKFISACEAGKGGVTYGGSDKATNIPQEFTCTLP
jgi:hypothetical protein